MCNRYPNIKQLALKDVFAHAMKFCQKVDPQAYKFIPKTYKLSDPEEMARFKKHQKKNPNTTFIAKPEDGGQGRGIALFKHLRELPYATQDSDIVVQRYLDKPLLLDGFKFDLRVYVVVTGFNPIQAYFYDEGLARFCTTKYRAPTKDNYSKTYMHLTNYSINKKNEDYVRPNEEEIFDENNATKRSLQSLYQTLAEKGIDVDQVKENIVNTCKKTMEIYGPLIEQQVTNMTNELDVRGKPF